jgi:hypothetical protein
MNIFAITPVKDSMPGPAARSMVKLAIEQGRRGYQFDYEQTWLSSNLPKARTKLARAAVASSADFVLFADDDIAFTPADVYALAALDCDFVSGMYTKRNEEGVVIGDPIGDDPIGDMLEMRRVGLGFCLVRRTALAAILEKHGDGAFEFRFDGTRIIGEDETFCDNWRAMGGQVWMHMQVQLGHIGPAVFKVPQ